MPVIEFGAMQAPKRNFQKINKFKLDANEKARVLIGLGKLEAQYVHNLERPLIENGEPVFHQVKRRDDTFVTEVKTEWVSTLLSQGDQSILADKGSDPKNCIIGAFAAKHPSWVKPEPMLKYAANIIRYQTKPGTYDVKTPFSVEAMVWAFSGKKYETLYEIAQEWGPDVFRMKDLRFGPCTNKVFQQFEISTAKDAAYLKNSDDEKTVMDTYNENKLEDLSEAIGRRKEDHYIQMDLDSIAEAWAVVDAYNARKAGLTVDLGETSADSSNELGGLLDSEIGDTSDDAVEAEELPTASEPTEKENTSFEDILKGL